MHIFCIINNCYFIVIKKYFGFHTTKFLQKLDLKQKTFYACEEMNKKERNYSIYTRFTDETGPFRCYQLPSNRSVQMLLVAK